VENFVDNPAEALGCAPAAAALHGASHMTEILIFLYFNKLKPFFAAFDREYLGKPHRFSMGAILCISQVEWREFDIC
jgi:hypothetical protein